MPENVLIFSDGMENDILKFFPIRMCCLHLHRGKIFCGVMVCLFSMIKGEIRIVFCKKQIN